MRSLVIQVIVGSGVISRCRSDRSRCSSIGRSWGHENVTVHGPLFGYDLVNVRYRRIRRRDSDVGHVVGTTAGFRSPRIRRRDGLDDGHDAEAQVMSVMMMRVMVRVIGVGRIGGGDCGRGRSGSLDADDERGRW